MAKLLNNISSDQTGTTTKVIGPTTIFVESTSLGGGTVSIYACREATTPGILLGSYTENSVVNNTIIGKHFLYATLSGSTGASGVTVSTSGPT